MIVERLAAVARGCILYDASRVRKPVDRLFDPQWWTEQGSFEKVTGGRASVALLRHEQECWVLRHYRRGGFIARISEDRYVWSGEAAARSFAEWRLLARLRTLQLPVPAPIAARYERGGLFYTADLITEFLPHTHTLANALRAEVRPETWRHVGAVVAAFHAHGVHHADLNAHNVLLKESGDSTAIEAYIIDFDRGRIRARGAWEAQVLARLRRSLDKISHQLDRAFDERQWAWFMEGYESAHTGAHLR